MGLILQGRAVHGDETSMAQAVRISRISKSDRFNP
jgi:hypothetical protein